MNNNIENIPVEVVVKYSETGAIIPLKIYYLDKVYNVDKLFSYRTSNPKGSFGVALQFNCLINGKKKQLFFDRYNGTWFVVKEYKM